MKIENKIADEIKKLNDNEIDVDTLIEILNEIDDEFNIADNDEIIDKIKQQLKHELKQHITILSNINNIEITVADDEIVDIKYKSIIKSENDLLNYDMIIYLINENTNYNIIENDINNNLIGNLTINKFNSYNTKDDLILINHYIDKLSSINYKDTLKYFNINNIADKIVEIAIELFNDVA